MHVWSNVNTPPTHLHPVTLLFIHCGLIIPFSTLFTINIHKINFSVILLPYLPQHSHHCLCHYNESRYSTRGNRIRCPKPTDPQGWEPWQMLLWLVHQLLECLRPSIWEVKIHCKANIAPSGRARFCSNLAPRTIINAPRVNAKCPHCWYWHPI